MSAADMTVDLRSMEEAKHGLAEREEQKSERNWSPVGFLLMVLSAVALALCVVQLVWF